MKESCDFYNSALLLAWSGLYVKTTVHALSSSKTDALTHSKNACTQTAKHNKPKQPPQKTLQEKQTQMDTISNVLKRVKTTFQSARQGWVYPPTGATNGQPWLTPALTHPTTELFLVYTLNFSTWVTRAHFCSPRLCIHVCLHMYTCIYVSWMCACICAYAFAHMHAYVLTHVHIHVCACC